MNSGEESSNTSLLFLWQSPFFLTCKDKDNIARVCGKPGEVIQLCLSTSRGNQAVTVSTVLSDGANSVPLILFCPWTHSDFPFLSRLMSLLPLLAFIPSFSENAHLSSSPCNIFLLSVLLWVWSALCIYVSSHPGCPALVDVSNVRGAFGRRCQRLAVLPRLEVSSNSGDPCWEICLCSTQDLAVR